MKTGLTDEHTACKQNINIIYKQLYFEVMVQSNNLGHCSKWMSCAFCCRQKRKERKQQRRLQRQNHHHQEEEEEGGEAQTVRKRPRREVTPSSLRLVVDCSFDDQMLIKVKCSGNRHHLCVCAEIWTEVLTLSCRVFRTSGSFTNRSRGATLRTDEPCIQCRLVAADWHKTVETIPSDV